MRRMRCASVAGLNRNLYRDRRRPKTFTVPHGHCWRGSAGVSHSSGAMMSSLLDAAMPQQNVVPETADAALLGGPLRSIADVEAIERTPFDERLAVVDFSQRIALALAARDPADTAIFFVPDGDVDRAPERVSFADLR